MECLGRTEEFQRDRFSDLEASAWRDYEEEYQWGFSYSPVPFLRVCSGGMHVRSLGTDRPSQWCRVGRSPGEERSLSFEYLSLASSFLFGLHPEKPMGPRHASTGRVDRMGSLSVTPWGRKRGFLSFRCLPRVPSSGAFTEETPVAIYHDQCKVLQAVAILSIGCSKCGITRDRSIGPTFLAFFTGLSWSKLWPHGSCPLPGFWESLWGVVFLSRTVPWGHVES